jgi:uncharacterized protein
VWLTTGAYVPAVRGRARGTVRVMNRRRLSLVLAAMLALAGCVDDAPDAAVEPPDAAVEPPDAAVEPPDADGEGGEAASTDEPAVPPLHPVIDDWDETVVRIRTAGGPIARVDAKVAATDEQRQRGLMEVEELPDGAGMLFVFQDERAGGFWMRNTLVPLDIAYVDADGTIATIIAMDPCEEAAAADCPTYVPETPYVTALEVPQGWFARVGVVEGDTVAWSTPRH